MIEKQFAIKHLISGGLITNYYCTSACKHCLYACSPHWKKEYITQEAAAEIMTTIRSLGCRSIHIGGGEPFLNFEGLLNVARVAQDIGMGIDYIETNSSWFKDEETAISLLRQLQLCGVSQLLVSISPFHNEFIPFRKVKGVLNASRKCGLRWEVGMKGFMYYYLIGNRGFLGNCKFLVTASLYNLKNIYFFR